MKKLTKKFSLIILFPFEKEKNKWVNKINRFIFVETLMDPYWQSNSTLTKSTKWTIERIQRHAAIVNTMRAMSCQTNRFAILYLLKFNHNGTCYFGQKILIVIIFNHPLKNGQKINQFQKIYVWTLGIDWYFVVLLDYFRVFKLFSDCNLVSIYREKLSAPNCVQRIKKSWPSNSMSSRPSSLDCVLPKWLAVQHQNCQRCK